MTIAIELLYPFLESRGISLEQLEVVEDGLEELGAVLTLAPGTATLIHRDAILEALKTIDDYPWKGESPREFREWLQAELKTTGVRYWLVGADTLPLEVGA